MRVAGLLLLIHAEAIGLPGCSGGSSGSSPASAVPPEPAATDDTFCDDCTTNCPGDGDECCMEVQIDCPGYEGMCFEYFQCAPGCCAADGSRTGAVPES